MCIDVEDQGPGTVVCLRALRIPYGAARPSMMRGEFYNQRFLLGFTDQQKKDLVAFLQDPVERIFARVVIA